MAEVLHKTALLEDFPPILSKEETISDRIHSKAVKVADSDSVKMEEIGSEDHRQE